MSRSVLAIAVASIALSGCGGGGDDSATSRTTASTTTAASSGAQDTQAYQAAVTDLIHQVEVDNKAFEKASGSAVIPAAKTFEQQLSEISTKLAALNARPSAKKYQDQIVAFLRKGANDMKHELSASHPNVDKIESISGRTISPIGPVLSSLYAAP